VLDLVKPVLVGRDLRRASGAGILISACGRHRSRGGRNPSRHGCGDATQCAQKLHGGLIA
jgi:hypothetical protein